MQPKNQNLSIICSSNIKYFLFKANNKFIRITDEFLIQLTILLINNRFSVHISNSIRL